MEPWDMDNALSELTAEYRNSLSEKHREISALKQQLEKCGWSDSALIHQLYQRIHKLAGSAGSYGFDQVSEAAIAIDLLIKTHRAGNILNRKKITAALELLLKRLVVCTQLGTQ